jgi:hypothetical protein
MRFKAFMGIVIVIVLLVAYPTIVQFFGFWRTIALTIYTNFGLTVDPLSAMFFELLPLIILGLIIWFGVKIVTGNKKRL